MLVTLCRNRFDFEVQRNKREDEAAQILKYGRNGGERNAKARASVRGLVPVQGAEIDLLVAGNDYYQHVEIPGGMYRGNDAPTKTFGVGATIVSSAEVPSHVIYEVVKAVFDNFESFKQLHPAFEGLSKKEMLGSGLTAPLHDGALKYYREARLTGYK